MSTTAYPVHVDASLDSGHLSRWLWLVKWFLAIPHYVVLAFLWMAFFLLSILAFFTIVFTGRYPRAIFDFNVGVLRWSWRVTYYTYGALATDRYPPFSLAEVPDYPAHLSVDYPGHLSRGLVWVKWWLLAIPHYIIVGVLVSGGLYFAYNAPQTRGYEWTGGWGLITILAVFAAFALLFTGRYPQQLFDLVLGLNRWVLRVAAYATLMTDEYPPFRLDQGGQDPSPARFSVPATTATAAPPAAPPAAPGTTGQAVAPPATGGIHWGPGRIIAVIVAAVVFFMGLGALAGGIGISIANASLRNDQGYLMSPTRTLSTGGYAITSTPFQLDTAGWADTVPRSTIGTIMVQATAPSGTPVFVGVARTSDVDAYLAGVQHATLLDFHDVNGNFSPVYSESPGGAPKTLPTRSDIWAASAAGSGGQQLTWEPRDGDWTMVVMNAAGRSGVTADLSVGATMPVLNGAMVGLFIAGPVLMVLGIVIVVLALNTGRRTSPEGAQA